MLGIVLVLTTTTTTTKTLMGFDTIEINLVFFLYSIIYTYTNAPNKSNIGQLHRRMDLLRYILIMLNIPGLKNEDNPKNKKKLRQPEKIWSQK